MSKSVFVSKYNTQTLEKALKVFIASQKNKAPVFSIRTHEILKYVAQFIEQEGFSLRTIVAYKIASKSRIAEDKIAQAVLAIEFALVSETFNKAISEGLSLELSKDLTADIVKRKVGHPEHYATSVQIVLADFASMLATRALLEAGLSKNKMINGQKVLVEMLIEGSNATLIRASLQTKDLRKLNWRQLQSKIDQHWSYVEIIAPIQYGLALSQNKPEPSKDFLKLGRSLGYLLNLNNDLANIFHKTEIQPGRFITLGGWSIIDWLIATKAAKSNQQYFNKIYNSGKEELTKAEINKVVSILKSQAVYDELISLVSLLEKNVQKQLKNIKVAASLKRFFTDMSEELIKELRQYLQGLK